jgi:hypothetical protein
VAGYVAEKGYDGARPLRIRPHWWVVLAVALSLLALVAASGSDHSGSKGRPHPARSIQLFPTGATGAKPTTTTTTVPSTTMSTTVTPPSSAPSAGPTGSGRGNVVTTQSASSPAATTTTTTAATVTTTPKLSAASTQPATPATNTEEPYSLQQPAQTTASFAFNGVGSMTVSVTWDYATPLSLTVSCPGGAQTKVGPSGLTIVIPNSGGPCTTTLKETIVQYNAVDFVMLIHPTDAG